MSDRRVDGTGLDSEYRARYDAFIAGLNVEGVRIASAEIDAPNAFDPGVPEPLQADISTSNDYTAGEGRFTARSRLIFHGRHPEEEQPRIVVRVTVEVAYTIATPITPDLFDTFAERNLPLNAWPYLREFLQSALARAGWPVYTLPAFKPATLQLQLDLE